MYPSSSFIMQVANLYIEMCSRDNEASACLEGLKHVFRYHAVSDITTANHRIVVCAGSQFEMTPKAAMLWSSPCLGVAGKITRHRTSLFTRLFARGKEVPRYSGTEEVVCYRDSSRNVDYFIPKISKWRIAHHVGEHITYVFCDGSVNTSDGLPSMLLHVIGSQYGCYLLFASCVAIQGEASLYMGNGGVGKSTVCMNLIQQGAAYMGDDLVLVYRDGTQTMVGSLLFPVKYVDTEQKSKQEIDIVAQSAQRPLLNAPLSRVYLLERKENTTAEPSVIPLQGEAMFEIMLKKTNKAFTHADGHRFADTISFICDYNHDQR